MLRQLRKRKTMKRILWTLAILIIPPFVFWGAGSALRSRQKGPTYAGIIFGKKISFEEYGSALEATKHQAMMIYGEKLDEIYESLQLEQQAWERLILLRETRKRKIRVSDSEIIQTIQRFPFFQSRGRFDERAYALILRQIFRIDARQFEEEMRDSLAITKLRDSIIKDIKITDEEVKEEYKKENEKSRIDYILISPNSFKKYTKITEARLKRYYEDNTESFRAAEQVNIEYLGFEFQDYQKGIEVSDEQLKTYYDKHKNGFDQKKDFKEVRDAIKTMVIKEKAKQNALAAAEKIDYALLDKTKTFEEVAKANSIPIKETGFFGREGIIPQIGWFPEIQKIAFRLNVGERSELIKTKLDIAKGFYIIRLKEKKPSYIPAFEEAKEKIETTLREEKAVELAAKEAGRLYKKIAELVKTKNMKFEDACLKIRHTPKYTEPFAQNGYIQGIGLAGELGEAAFKINDSGKPVAAKTRAGFCIFKVVEIIPADEEKFKKEKEEFAKKALETKRLKILNEWYYDLLKTANLTNNVPPLEN